MQQDPFLEEFGSLPEEPPDEDPCWDAKPNEEPRLEQGTLFDFPSPEPPKPRATHPVRSQKPTKPVTAPVRQHELPPPYVPRHITYDEYLKKGFIPLANGGRAGVCGARANSGGWAEIYSINLRIPRFVPNAAEELIRVFALQGIKSTLVCSPPATGKTTFLKSAAYLLSNGIGIAPARVGIADERGELLSGISDNGLIDPCLFLPKAQGIELLTRVMSPEIIVCDEISVSDAESVIEAHNCGVSLIASAHCENARDLLSRGRMKALADPELFPLCVILGLDGGYSCVIRKTEELL